MLEKLYRPLVLVLLSILVVAQVFAGMASSKCKSAIESAEVINQAVSKQLAELTADYETAVYEQADNINQQIFRVNEYEFFALQIMALSNTALLSVASTCQ